MSYLIVILGIIGIVAFSVKFTQIAVVRPLRKQMGFYRDWLSERHLGFCLGFWRRLGFGHSQGTKPLATVL